MKVLGIDPGTMVTGYGIVEARGAKLIYLSSGEIRMKKGMALEKRLLRISEGVERLMEEWRPDVCAVESVFFANNVKTALILGHARGVVLLSAVKKGITLREYSPKTVKQTVTGYGAAAKDGVQKMVKLLLKIPNNLPPDVSDALAIAICHIHHSNVVMDNMTSGAKIKCAADCPI